MKNSLKTAAVYIGLVIGAGFASGREIMEYFNFKSSYNGSGVLCASFLFMLICYIIGDKAADEGIGDFDDYIVSVSGRAAPFVKYFMLAYMFCGIFVMFAGFGALVDSAGGFSCIGGIVLIAVICFMILSFDISGVVALNAVLVPIMIGGILFVSVCYIIFGEASTFLQALSPFPAEGGNLGISESGIASVILSAVCYASYNTLTAGAVLVPLSKDMTAKELRRAAVAGGFVIGIMVIFIWTIQGMSLENLWKSELPMLTVAAMCGKQCKRIYTAVLCMAICTTAVSYGFGVMSHFSAKIKSRKERISYAAVICLAAVPPALYGFSRLVSQLYGFFGYAGVIWLIWILTDRLKNDSFS